MASANICPLSSLIIPRTSASHLSAPGLIPNMNLPFDKWSSIAAWEATNTGCIWERFDVPVPSLILFVSDIKLDKKIILFVIFSDLSVRCSPIKAS